MQTLRNFRRRSLAEKRLLCQAWCLLGISRLAINVVAFKRLAARLGQHDAESGHDITESQLAETKLISWAVDRAACFTPWSSNCFPRAITALYLLRRRDIPATLYLGCRLEADSEMKAHAWLRSGPRIVTGRPGHQQYSVVATFRTDTIDPGNTA